MLGPTLSGLTLPLHQTEVATWESKKGKKEDNRRVLHPGHFATLSCDKSNALKGANDYECFN
jgi:hypothetical protein